MENLEKKAYSLQLKNEFDICEELENILTESRYICDQISESADSSVDIYNYDLWEKAGDFREWTEEAVSEGLVNTSDFDLISTFQAGQYQYYTQMAYDNEKEIYFNILINIVNEDIEKYKDITIEAIEEMADEIDHNDSGDIFQEKLAEYIENLEE